MSTSIAQGTGRGTSLRGSVTWWIALVSVVAALAVGAFLGRVSAPTRAQPAQVVAVHQPLPVTAGEPSTLEAHRLAEIKAVANRAMMPVFAATPHVAAGPIIDHQGVPRHKWGPTQKPLP